MAVLYVKEQGATVQRMGERILVTKNNQTLLDLPVIKVENVSIIGNVQVTTQALRMLLENGIDVSYFTYSGKYLGHTGAESSKNIFLRFEQYGFYLDEKRRLKMARVIVDNKICNQMQIIKEHHWIEGNANDYKDELCHMDDLRMTLQKKNSANEILGVEGMCSNLYFSVFAKMIRGDFVFEQRNRRPPRDPVNIILSLAYTFLTKEVSNALDSESFESYLGFLHGIRYGRKSLALDIVEEFRQPVVDRMTILLFNKRMIGAFDFDESENGEIILNESGFKKFCSEYERWITGRNTLAGENFRKRIQEQVALLKKCMLGETEYRPFSWREH